MGRHTPGPWGFTYDGSSGWSIGEATDPQGLTVASIHDRSDERAKANARLIAAAPDLLAACEAALLSSPGDGAIRISAAKRALIRAAIAKARGDK